MRTLETEAENLLRDYEIEMLGIARKYPALHPGRAIALGKLRAAGIKRVKGLVAEFGEGSMNRLIDTIPGPGKGTA